MSLVQPSKLLVMISNLDVRYYDKLQKRNLFYLDTITDVKQSNPPCYLRRFTCKGSTLQEQQDGRTCWEWGDEGGRVSVAYQWNSQLNTS